MGNLIFIEGISGVGKSTISTTLCEKLRNLGYSANCFLEGDINSPLDLFYVSYLTGNEYVEMLRSYPVLADELRKESIIEPDYILVRYQDTERKYFAPELYGHLKARELCFNAENPIPMSKYGKVFINLWRRFAENETANKVNYIFDGSLLHHQINDLIRNYNASENQIASHLRMLVQAIESLNPVVFYLSTKHVGDRLTKARESRRQTPPTCKQIEFWQKRKQIDLSMLEKLPIESYIIDISDGNWDVALENIISSITLSKPVGH